MDFEALKIAEQTFLGMYPEGFNSPEMLKILKKHKMEQLEKQAKESFSKKNFDDTQCILDELIRIVSRSSMISMFEKPKFKAMIGSLNTHEANTLVDALYELIHGKEKLGFEVYLQQLDAQKLAKWTLATVVQTYYRPQKEVLVKPTTTKLIIDKLSLDLTYNAKPSWDFYRQYRKIINDMKKEVDKSLAPNNPAFCGFLMTALAPVTSK